MTSGSLPLLALTGVFVLAAATPLLTRLLGRNAGYALALGFLVAAVLIGSDLPAVLRGDAVTWSVPWVPSLGVELSLRLDGLSLLFSLLVLGIGALVGAYSGRYFKPGAGEGRILALMVLFAGSMLGLVLADDLIALFVFWELTSVTSFFLIGGVGGEKARRPAIRALLVTAGGGLVLFAGLVMLGVVAGTFDLGTILADPGFVREHALGPPILACVLVGAFAKSAQFPFHFWLPGAMVAPTPVSTYLHAATMVKAGIYLLARLSPLFAGWEPYLYTVTFVGLGTALLGGVLALKQHDVKALLAYSTVSQLGFIIALVGMGTPEALVAATVHIIAHAAFKATLFMVAGIVDLETGSRDMRDLSGLWRAMPFTFGIAAVAATSMAGLPPMLGFVSKEAAFEGFLHAPAGLGLLSATAAVLASIATFAYTARFLHGTFAGPHRRPVHDPSRMFLAPAALSAMGGLALGTVPWALEGFVGRVAGDTLSTLIAPHLALWHGFTPALGLSALAVAGGLITFANRRAVDRRLARARFPVSGARAFDGAYDGAVELGRRTGDPFTPTPPARYLTWVLAAATAAGLGAWFAYGEPPSLPPPPIPASDWIIVAILSAAAVGVMVLRRRLAAVAVLGIAGFLLAAFYVVLGAPDLALTQLLIETLTVTLIVLVFRRLPILFRAVPAWRRLAAGLVAGALGVLSGVAAYGLTGRREIDDSPFLEAAPTEAGGHNVVNTILVDFRALDTLGEITVIIIAAVGVFLLVRHERPGRER